MSFPALSPEQFALTFPRYSREDQKRLNQGDPNYAPKSAFTAALADKRGLNLQATLERLKLRGFTDFAERAATMRARVEIGVAEREAENVAFASYSRAMSAARKEAPGFTHRATPEGGFFLPGHDMCQPLQGVGLGVHVEGTPHFGQSSHSESQRGARGRGELHGGSQVREPRRGALDLAMFLMDVERAERAALELAGKPGGAKAHKKALYLRETYTRRLAEHQGGGLMQRLESFSEHAGRRSTRGRAEAEKIKGEKARM